MNKIYCNDGCQKEFTLDDLTMKNEELKNDIERYYIECPNCKQQYTSYYLSEPMKKIQKEIQALREKAPLKIKQKNRLSKLIRKLVFMSNTIKITLERDSK